MKEKKRLLEEAEKRTRLLQHEVDRSRSGQKSEAHSNLDRHRVLEGTSSLEVEIEKAKEELKKKEEDEMILRASLEEAMGLLKPLEKHLKKAEQEKKALRKQVKALYSKENSPGEGNNIETKSARRSHSEKELSKNMESLEETLRKKEECERRWRIF